MYNKTCFSRLGRSTRAFYVNEIVEIKVTITKGNLADKVILTTWNVMNKPLVDSSKVLLPFLRFHEIKLDLIQQ